MEASGVVWLGAKLREESLKIRTRYKEWYGERNIVDLQRWILKNINILHARNNSDGKASF